jgi:hypothetical protein
MFPKLPQYPLKPQTIQGVSPVLKDLIDQVLIIPYISPYSTNSPVKRQNTWMEIEVV